MTKNYALLLSSHNLNLGTLAMQIVESELSSTGSDVVDTASKTFSNIVNLGPSWNFAFQPVFVDVGRQRARNMELVRVWVGVL